MKHYGLEIFGLNRILPIVPIGPKIRVASVNLLGDRELVNAAAVDMAKKLKKIKFDYLVGPEVKVVPLLHELANILNHERYVICRKGIMGYMTSPVKTPGKTKLVLDGKDADLLRGKKVVLVDDVVSTGKTLGVLRELMGLVDATVVTELALFKQGDFEDESIADLIYFETLPVFRNEH